MSGIIWDPNELPALVQKLEEAGARVTRTRLISVLNRIQAHLNATGGGYIDRSELADLSQRLGVFRNAWETAAARARILFGLAGGVPALLVASIGIFSRSASGASLSPVLLVALGSALLLLIVGLLGHLWWAWTLESAGKKFDSIERQFQDACKSKPIVRVKGLISLSEYTNLAKTLILAAQRIADNREHANISPLHVLAAALEYDEIKDAFRAGVDKITDFQQLVLDELRRIEPSADATRATVSSELSTILDQAREVAAIGSRSKILAKDLLGVLLGQTTGRSLLYRCEGNVTPIARRLESIEGVGYDENNNGRRLRIDGTNDPEIKREADAIAEAIEIEKGLEKRSVISMTVDGDKS